MSVKSNIPGVSWPPIQTGYAATLSSMVAYLEKSQYFDIGYIKRRQSEQLINLVNHHYANTPSFLHRVKQANLDGSGVNVDWLKQLPVIDKSYIQQCGHEFTCSNIPHEHTPYGESKTSGSTGQPVTVMRSITTQLMLDAMTMRDHIWHKRSFAGRLCAVRANIENPGIYQSWGKPVAAICDTGPSLGLNVSTPVNELMQRIREFQPSILTIHANVLNEMIDIWQKTGFDQYNLMHVKNIGDTVSQDLRAKVKNVIGLELEDVYSSSETGAIAIECPEGHMYHICSESLIVEILREDGSDCLPGEIGKVVITDLHNFASPVIRYDIGDYAEIGTPCKCGRTLPTLKQIYGRERNIFIRPDGSKFWPKTGMHEVPNVIYLKQWQIIQHDYNTIEYKMVCDQDPTAEQHAKIIDILERNLGYKPNITITTQRDFLPRTTNGKFEEAICMIKRS